MPAFIKRWFVNWATSLLGASEEIMPAFIKRWFVNWATSLLGASAGGVLILEGLSNDDYSKVVQGVLVLLLGLFAKDGSTTGNGAK